MTSHSRLTWALAGLLAGAALLPSMAQAQEPSTTCRLFPLACPGATPAPPPPLIGTPEEQQAEAPPPPAPARTHAHARTHGAKHKHQHG